MKIKEVANLVGISVRTLHYYDDIGLLVPDTVSEAGYRQYSEKNLEMLQQILFFKTIGFPLKEIKTMIENPTFNQEEALLLQRKLLVEKRNNMNTMIHTIDKTIQHMKGEIYMSHEERFEGLSLDNTAYEQEARERWGDSAIDEVKTRLKQLSDDDKKTLEQQWDIIFKNFATLRNQAHDSDAVQDSVQVWYDFLNNNFSRYTLEAFKGLAELYINDVRFTENIDKYADGLSTFLNKAMITFVNIRQNK